MGQSTLDLRTELFNRRCHCGKLTALLSGRGQLLLLRPEGVEPLLYLLALACKLWEVEDATEVGIQEAVLVALEFGEGVACTAQACLELLREPLSALGALERSRNEMGLEQDSTEILPDYRVKLRGGNVARVAASGSRRHRIVAPADVVPIAIPSRARHRS